MCIFACYDIPNVQIDGYDVVRQQAGTTSAYRAPGATNAAFACETVVDETGREARSIDPLEFRLKNAAKEGTRRADGPVYPRIGMIETLRGRARTATHYKTPLDGHEPRPGRRVRLLVQHRPEVELHGQRQRRRHGQPGRRLDRHRRHAHLASPCSWPRRWASRAEDVRPQRRRHRLGRLHRRHRRQPRHLRHRLGRLRGRPGHQAADDRPGRARSGSATPDDVDVRGRRADRKRPAQALTFKELAGKLHAHRRHRSSAGPASIRRGSADGFATHIVDVEVDPETGKVTILRYTAVQDVGQGDPPQLRRGPDAGRRRAGHRLGAERGVLLRRPGRR